jgi:hypothetical protein
MYGESLHRTQAEALELCAGRAKDKGGAGRKAVANSEPCPRSAVTLIAGILPPTVPVTDETEQTFDAVPSGNGHSRELRIRTPRRRRDVVL